MMKIEMQLGYQNGSYIETLQNIEVTDRSPIKLNKKGSIKKMGLTNNTLRQNRQKNSSIDRYQENNLKKGGYAHIIQNISVEKPQIE